MSDPRVETVAQVLRDAGHNATGTGHTTDDLATMIVNALDESDAAGGSEEVPAGDSGDGEVSADTVPTNPETPVGTGTEGGTADATA
jgi:hypothetical protein